MFTNRNLFILLVIFLSLFIFGVFVNADRGSYRTTTNTIGDLTQIGDSGDTDNLAVYRATSTFNGNMVITGVLTVNDSVCLNVSLLVDTTTFYVDKENNRVSVGTTDPEGRFEVRDWDTDSKFILSCYSSSNGKAPIFYLDKSHSDTPGTLVTTVNGEQLGRFFIRGVDSENNKDLGLLIDVIQDGNSAGRVPTNVIFETYSNTAKNTSQFVLHNDGKIGIGVLDPDQALEVTGDVHISGLEGAGFDVFASATGVLIEDPSDVKFKKNITSIKNALEMVKQLKGRHYSWKDGAPAIGTEYGLIAQEVAEVSKDLIVVGDHMGVKSKAVIALLIEAVKEQQEQIESLEKIINNIGK